MKFLIGLILFLLAVGKANAITCGPVPYTFVPGTTIQSNQVNSNFTALQGCISGVAGSGTNADINILNGTGSGVAVFGAPTNSSASAGYVGEYISSDLPFASQISLSTGVAKNITSVSLTPGDWDCSGVVDTQNTVNFIAGWISTTGNTTPSSSYETSGLSMAQQGWGGVITAAAVGMVRYSLSVTTTVYLEMFASFGGSASGYGLLRCRRVR